MSDPPLRLTKRLRKWLLTMNKKKTTAQRLAMLTKLRPSMVFGFEGPAVAEFSTKETMGQSCDKVTKTFGVSREDQDKFGLRSHEMAAKAQKEGLLSDVEPINLPKVGSVSS